MRSSDNHKPGSGRPSATAPAGMPSPMDAPLCCLRTVGPRGAGAFGKLGIATVGDLLRHIPRRYEDRRHFASLAHVVSEDPVLVRVRVVGAEGGHTRHRGLHLTRVTVSDDTGIGELVFFRQPYLVHRFQEMARRRAGVVVYGTPRLTGYGPVAFEHPEWEPETAGPQTLGAGRIVPVYASAEGLSQERIRRAVRAALEQYGNEVPDALPGEMAASLGLPDAPTAYRQVHFPDDLEAAETARRRLVFEEFLVLQVGLAIQRRRRTDRRDGLLVHGDHDSLRARLAAFLPFELTAGQRDALADIEQDLASGFPMNRLLHGDVGSGKTAVAVAAMLLVLDAGHQVAMMAPTEILAQQHHSLLTTWLEPLGVPVVLATGRGRTKARDRLREQISSGSARVVVGTHALIEEDVRFASLGLVVIDEQHRFGVLQRQALRGKGRSPHVLVMTATPIPRTLTMTLYGDLDVSCIMDKPPGRRPIRTHWKRPEESEAVYAGVAKLLAQGRQAYVVCPLVEESERLEAAAATRHAERVAQELLPGWRVGLLHGQMRSDEKEAAMAAFLRHEFDVLVATSLIEVGIDVPNAAVMVVEDADRFGLAQLHQLRGRVGRGAQTSFCVLLADPRTDEGLARLSALTETNDGFRIAEEDLRLRGPGEFLGTKQSGLPELHFGDLLRDEVALTQARSMAAEIVSADPKLAEEAHSALRLAIAAKWKALLLTDMS